MSTSVEGTWQAILIGEVETIGASIPAASSVANVLAATPGWLFIPAPTRLTLPRSSRALQETPRPSSVRAASALSSTGAEKTISALVCTIVSTFTDASASAPKSCAGLAPSTRYTVSSRWCTTPEISAFSSISSSSSWIHVPVSFLEGRADVEPHIVATRDLDRAGGHHAGARGRHLEHLVEADARQLARAGDDAWVGGVDAEDVGVDLAVVGAERGRERDGGRVGAAAAERRHLERRRDALEAGDEHDLALVERLVDAARAHLDDLGLAVHGVGDDPRLRAGERDRLVAEVVDHHRGERARDPLADRDQHVELARVRRRRDLLGERRAARRSCDPSRRGRRRRDGPPRGRRRAARRRASASPGRRRTCRRTSSRRCRAGVPTAVPRRPRRPPERPRTRSRTCVDSLAVAPAASPKKPTKNAEPTNPKAHRFSSLNLLAAAVPDASAPGRRNPQRAEKFVRSRGGRRARGRA